MPIHFHWEVNAGITVGVPDPSYHQEFDCKLQSWADPWALSTFNRKQQLVHAYVSYLEQVIVEGRELKWIRTEFDVRSQG